MSRLIHAASLRRSAIAVAIPIALAQAMTIAAAQSNTATPSVGRSNPLDASAAVPQLTYESSFRNYRPLGNDKVGGWKEANDNVGRIGGWRVYAREAATPDAVTTQPASSATESSPIEPVKAAPTEVAPTEKSPRPHVGGHKMN